jgi:aminoglycoside phosphotransferase (APT) family kinase protein
MSSAVTKNPVVDPRFPTLHAVLDPCELRQGLKRVLPAEWGEVREIQIEVLQYHRASRCTLDLRLQTTTGERELIGKVYATDRRDVYRVMKQISETGFGPKEEFSIPEPLSFIPELNLLLQEKVAGPLAKEIFLTGSESERAYAAERCALWLANFHTHAPQLGSAFAFVVANELLESWAQRLAKRAEQVVAKAVQLFEGLAVIGRKHSEVQARFCHGDYCHYQIILNDTRTVTLDWDGYCLADPTLDVARFMIILQQLALNWQGSIKALNATGEVFYRTYTAASKFDVAKDLPFYKAALCLKCAKDFAKRDDVRPLMAEAMVDEGLRILAEEI